MENVDVVLFSAAIIVAAVVLYGSIQLRKGLTTISEDLKTLTTALKARSDGSGE